MKNIVKEKYNSELILNLAYYILENKTTVRATAKVFNIPKSTVHNNLSYKLKSINHTLYLQVKKLMENNFKIKHIHGGESTKRKYQILKQNINIIDEIEAINF